MEGKDGQMDDRQDGRMDRWTDIETGWTDGQTERQDDGRTVDRTDGWTDRQTGWTDGQTDREKG